MPLKRGWTFILGFLLSLLMLSAPVQQASAQTPGLIYKPATNGGAAVLDPNNDGYVSASPAGFSTNDETESEIPFRRFPLLGTEPLGDLNTGAAGGHTDLAPAPLYAYFNGKHLMFRFRLGGQSTASKGYSVLIDTDNRLQAAGTNPGFEFEVLLASNFSVQVIDHRTAPSQVIFNGNVDQYHQRAIALTRANNDPDYFYDFYVPITAFGNGITASTPLRFTGFTVTSAQSGLTGTVSDVGGLNFASYNFNSSRAWQDVISTFPPTTLNQIQAGAFGPVRSFCPAISAPIIAGATTVSGTTIEPAGTTIRVYSGSGTTPLGTTVTTSASWSVTVPAIAPNTVITATAQASGEAESVRDCNPVTVSGDCTRPVAPTITGLTSNQNGFTGTSNLPIGTPINIYQVTGGGSSSTLYLSGTVSSTTAPNFTVVFSTTGQQKVANGEYFAKAVVNGCESNRSNYFCVGLTASGAVSIAGPVVAGANTVSGNLSRTVTGNATIVVFADGLQVGTATIGSGVSAWTVTLAQGTNLRRGQVLTARGFEEGRCSSVSANETVVRVASAPTITGKYCGPTQTVIGTSTEAAGTNITVFATAAGSTTAEQVGTATVNAFGTWTDTLTQVVNPGSTLIARVANTADGILQSPASNAVTIEPISSNANLVVNGPILEGDNTITGTYPTEGAIIRVYIDGSQIMTQEPITVLGNGTWGVVGISPFETFAGARVTATVQTGTNCESLPSSAVVIQCLPPLQRDVRPATGAVCIGSMAAIQILRSERGIIYQLEGAAEGTTNFVRSGTSVVGTGGDIILTSAAVNQRTTFRVVATQVTGTTCSTVLTQTATINATPLPAQGSSVVSGPATVCANTRANISITNSNPRFSYQLRIGTTPVGGATIGRADGGTLTLQTDPIVTATTYNVFVTDTDTGCSNQFSPVVTISPSGASANQAVTVANTALCVGGSSSISVATENNANYSYQIFEQVGTNPRTAVGAAFTGTGAVVQRPLGPFSTAGARRYIVEVSNSASGAACPVVTLASQPTINVSNNATISVAGPAQILCEESTAMLMGNTPENGTGQWTLVTAETTDPSPNVVIAQPSNPNTQVSGLRQGYTYVFRWRITVTCGTTVNESSSITTVKINCPSRYEVAPARFLDEYQNGDILATPFDIDRGVIGAELVEGTTLPPGVLYSPSTGLITVGNRFGLVPGTYSFRVALTDATGNRTVVTVTLTFNGPTPDTEPLPVDLVFFKAFAEGGNIRLDWRTASELNNDRFLVQRSIDGYNFKTIGNVGGNGNSHRVIDYKFIDRNPQNGRNYYRLVQVDYDGTETKSPITSATISGITQKLKVYPNPTRAKVNILRTGVAAEDIRVVIQDIKGITVMERQLSALNGQDEIAVDMSSLPGGIYLLTIEGTSTDRQVIRVVKVD